jgi:hypothetical protein
MKRGARSIAILELAWLFSLWTATVWGAWRFSGASLWTALGITAMLATVACSVWIRRPGWRECGFRLDNFFPALMRVGLVTVGLLALAVAWGKMAGISLPPVSASRAVEALVSGALQEAFMFGYMFQRWNVIIGNPAGAVAANALTFALIHLPDPSFAAFSVFGGILFGALFVMNRNVLVLGLAHSAVLIFILPMVRQGGIIQTTRVGPRSIDPLVETLARELLPGDRIGVGPRGVPMGGFEDNPSLRFETIAEESAGDPGSNSDRVNSFLLAPQRVFWIVPERDFHRYVGPELRKRLFILSDRYMWKEEVALKDFFSSGDIPVIAALRERVLLVSNRPAIKDSSLP